MISGIIKIFGGAVLMGLGVIFIKEGISKKEPINQLEKLINEGVQESVKESIQEKFELTEVQIPLNNIKVKRKKCN